MSSGFDCRPVFWPGRSAGHGESYFVFAREISDYKELPITVGTYVLARAVDAPIKLLYSATLLAMAMLAVALVAGAVMATAISRPIRRAAKGATAIGQLDFDQVAPLSHSMFREIESLATSFNAMLEVLKAFGRYVPRSLVMRLIKEGRFGAGTTERAVAIMFTDIVSFTAICEKMTAIEVAAFINHHLTLIAACVEHEGGTIDKFIGDAVMAFWGAPSSHGQSGRGGLPGRDCHSSGARRRQQGARRGRPRAGPHPHRHPYGSGRGRRYRRPKPDQLHHRRRCGERDAAAGKSRQGRSIRTPRRLCWSAAMLLPRRPAFALSNAARTALKASSKVSTSISSPANPTPTPIRRSEQSDRAL